MLFTAAGIVTAAGPDVVGKTYADAVTVIEQWGRTAVVAARTGDRLPLDQCIVVGVSSSSYVRPLGGPVGEGPKFGPIRNEMRLSLNCNGSTATANTPGYSAASPEAQAAKEEQESIAWKGTPEGQQWCKRAKREHPQWFPIEGC